MSAETGPAAGRASVESLPDTWRMRAKTLRRYGAETSAVALEACAAELETALRQRDETTPSAPPLKPKAAVPEPPLLEQPRPREVSNAQIVEAIVEKGLE